MINRVLIRIKTVQLLYSYILVQKPFSLESQPSSPTKEKRFAYNLYLDVIYLLYKIAHRIQGKNKVLPLAQTSFIAKLEDDEKLKALKHTYSSGNYPFASIEGILSDQIKNSFIYSEFKENKNSDGALRIWEDIFKSIIINSPEFNSILTSLSGYSLSGVERMKTMMENTFSNFYATRENINDALSTLKKSMDKARELYMRLLSLPVELTNRRRDQLTISSRKFTATIDDINPNMRFVENYLPKLIEDDSTYQEYIEKNPISLISEDPELLSLLLRDILNSDLYKDYMQKSSNDLKSDLEFWREVYKQIIFENENFLEYMENKSVFWNDDLEIIGTFVLKTLRRFEESENKKNAVLPMFKDEEDSLFGEELFKSVVKNKDIYHNYINKFLEKDKWDSERLAFMDVVITMTALAEILNFPKIPLVVSINEYIEIAKSYSTSKSGSFVHGLLAGIISNLQEDGVLKK